jgi:hypothetical protein
MLLVECYWPTVSEREIREVMAGLAERSLALPIGAVLVPADGTALLLFGATDAEVVRRAGADAEIPFDRVVPAITVAAPSCVTDPSSGVGSGGEDTVIAKTRPWSPRTTTKGTQT